MEKKIWKKRKEKRNNSLTILPVEVVVFHIYPSKVLLKLPLGSANTNDGTRWTEDSGMKDTKKKGIELILIESSRTKWWNCVNRIKNLNSNHCYCSNSIWKPCHIEEFMLSFESDTNLIFLHLFFHIYHKIS